MQPVENVPLAPYTTFGIGGPARWFAEAASEADVPAALAFARERGLPVFVLGGGSNLLVSDGGFPGLVLHIALRGVEESGNGEVCSFSVAAGEDWDVLVARTVALDCAGIECLSGIPGTVGGTPVQNVGAYGQEVAQTITRVRAFDTVGDHFVDLSAGECGFAYRTSIFNSTERGRYIVTRVDYALRQHGAATIAYADLQRRFAGQPTPSLAQVREAVIAIRAQKGMVIVANEQDCRSAGSFFKNPLVPAAALPRIAGAVGLDPERVPQYPAGNGTVKLAAAWLLEQAGFKKGFALGNVGISSRHTLALVNRGGASAAEVIKLRDRIVAEVEARFGVHLEQEPVLVG